MQLSAELCCPFTSTISLKRRTRTDTDAHIEMLARGTERAREGRKRYERDPVKARAAARAEAAICQVVSDRYIDKIELGFGDCTKVTEQISAAS